MPRHVICLELHTKIETFIQITEARGFCGENMKCLYNNINFKDKMYLI